MILSDRAEEAVNIVRDIAQREEISYEKAELVYLKFVGGLKSWLQIGQKQTFDCDGLTMCLERENEGTFSMYKV